MSSTGHNSVVAHDRHLTQDSLGGGKKGKALAPVGLQMALASLWQHPGAQMMLLSVCVSVPPAPLPCESVDFVIHGEQDDQ